MVSNLTRTSKLLVAACVWLGLAAWAEAQSDTWDDLLTGSQWYVPADNLLAYVTPGSNLASPQPVADQTIWNITSSVDGVFTGTSVTTFELGSVVTSSTTTMNGVVTDGGQIRIAFSQEGQPPTIGIGQVQTVNGNTLFEMQMISGSANAVFVTHWAYMALYDGNPSSLPPLEVDGSSGFEEWQWMQGTQWSLTSPELFGQGGAGSFQIQGYHNGYFWGVGTGPLGSDTETFSLIGSATPEGNLLFSVLNNGETQTLTSLTGQITGGPDDGTMALQSYEASGSLGDLEYAYVIPEPSTALLFGLTLCGLWRFRRRGLLALR